MKRQVHSAVRRLGYQLTRYPHSDPLYSLVLLLRHLKVEVVLDIGANAGQFALDIRRLGYVDEIHSFEPVSTPFRLLAANSAKDPRWAVHNCALGAESGEQDIFIAANHAASSSMLSMLDRHATAAPDATYIGSETVDVSTLDNFTSLHQFNRTFVKIDVQGFEHEVMRGGQAFLRSDTLVGLQLELSLLPLYEGGMLWEEGLAALKDLGFRLAGISPGFRDQVTGELLQFDGIFVRN